MAGFRRRTDDLGVVSLARGAFKHGDMCATFESVLAGSDWGCEWGRRGSCWRRARRDEPSRGGDRPELDRAVAQMGMSAYGLFSPVAYGPTYPAPAAGDVTAAGSSVEIDAPTRATRAMSRSTSSGPIERGWDEPWYRAAAGLERLDGQRLQRRSFDGEQLADRAGTGRDAPGFVGPDPTRRSACSRAPASRSRGRERSGCGEPSRSGPRRRLSRGRLDSRRAAERLDAEPP